MQHLFTGKEPQRHGNTSPDTCPSGVFQASDKAFYINCGNNKIFQRLMTQVLERPDLADDPGLRAAARTASRAATSCSRMLQRGLRRAALGALAAAHARRAWSPAARCAPCGQAMRSRRSARARRWSAGSPHPHAWAGCRTSRSPIRFSSHAAGRPGRRAQHRRAQRTQVLRERLGYGDAAHRRAGRTGVRPAHSGRPAR